MNVRCHEFLRCNNPAVPPLKFLCRRHWAALQRSVKHAVSREARLGDLERYASVTSLAVYRLLRAPAQTDAKAAARAASAILAAVVRQQVCIQRGHGNPLAGLLDETETQISMDMGMACLEVILSGATTEHVLEHAIREFGAAKV